MNNQDLQHIGKDEAAFISINLETYKRQFFQLVSIVVVLIVMSYIIVNISRYDLSLFIIRRMAVPIMAVLAVLAFVHSFYRKRQLQRLDKMNSFDQKVQAYEKIYKFRLQWFVFSAGICCGLYVLSLHRLFLFFALFDLLLLIGNYPNKTIFKKELNHEDIIFY